MTLQHTVGYQKLSSLYSKQLTLTQSEMKRSRLSMECAKLKPAFERAMAEEGLAEDVSQWPE
jgi:hypothetical protein